MSVTTPTANLAVDVAPANGLWVPIVLTFLDRFAATKPSGGISLFTPGTFDGA